MSDFETNRIGTLMELHRAKARIAELEGALAHYANRDHPREDCSGAGACEDQGCPAHYAAKES